MCWAVHVQSGQQNGRQCDVLRGAVGDMFNGLLLQETSIVLGGACPQCVAKWESVFGSTPAGVGFLSWKGWWVRVKSRYLQVVQELWGRKCVLQNCTLGSMQVLTECLIQDLSFIVRFCLAVLYGTFQYS